MTPTGEFDRDGRLRLGGVPISKAGVSPYLGRELLGWQRSGLDPNKTYLMLRDPDELRKAATTFAAVPLLRRHMVLAADNHSPDDVVGTTGTDAKFDAPFLTTDLTIWAQDAIDAIESGSRRALSIGFHFWPDMTPGVFGGRRYDGVLREMRGNHVAIVGAGRAGPDVAIDAAFMNFSKRRAA